MSLFYYISLRFCSTSNVDSGDKYDPNLQQLAKDEVIHCMGIKLALTPTRAPYGQMLIKNMGIYNPTTCVY